MTTKLFVVFAVLMLGLTGTAAYRDASGRDYLSIQAQYAQDHPGSTINPGVQQLFPQYAAANVAGTFRVERCISCHTPDIGQIGPDQAAKNLASDFFKYQPNAAQIAKDNHLSGVHPAYIALNADCVNPNASKPSSSATAAPSASPSATASSSSSPAPAVAPSSTAAPTAGSNPAPSPGATTTCPAGSSSAVNYSTYGPSGYYTYSYQTATGSQIGKEPGYLSSNVAALITGQSTYVGIDQVGCIVCHNGGRLSLAVDDSANSPDRSAHENLIVNPNYAWTEGAQLYYKTAQCVSCHAPGGAGGTGPPLSNQDRLGFFNEDYYYRCIEYGMTGFEHVGTLMPNWGGVSADYVPADHITATNPKGAPLNPNRVLTEPQIDILTQFIRHWEKYETLP